MVTKYEPTHKMRELVSDNSMLLMAMSRFGISLGFGDKTVKETCRQQDVDVATFLAVANYISGKDYDTSEISVSSLMSYLKRAHSYFLDFIIPSIRRKLIEAIDCSGNDEVAFLILRFYDEYVTEVRRHMQYENDEVFSYVENLLQHKVDGQYSIATFANKHNHIAPKLHELKEIIIAYYPQQENDLLNSLLFDIINCEQDLTSHCQVEDDIFVPAVERLEKTIEDLNRQNIDKPDAEGDSEDATEMLSQREKEIIRCVATGLSNKEIADELCLSVHTVTTHRRNIAAKLQIHSPAGLTIYAIVNKIVKLQDIKNS